MGHGLECLEEHCSGLTMAFSCSLQLQALNRKCRNIRTADTIDGNNQATTHFQICFPSFGVALTCPRTVCVPAALLDATTTISIMSGMITTVVTKNSNNNDSGD